MVEKLISDLKSALRPGQSNVAPFATFLSASGAQPNTSCGGIEPKRCGKGGRISGGPGESYSDVILRLAAEAL